MATDDLDTPLGQNAKPKRRFKLPIRPAHIVVGALVLALMTFAGWAVIVDDPLGGEPMAVLALAAPPPKANAAMPPVTAAPGPSPGAPPPAAPAPPTVTPAVPPPPPDQTVVIIDGSTGKRLEVPIPAPPGQVKMPGHPPKAPPAEQKFLEHSRHGLIPRVGTDGVRPADVYARIAATPSTPDAPRIAIVIAGLGVSTTATQDALGKLPGAVTLAFLPYGSEIERSVTRARTGGHEVLLQLPMEPFDYPDNDPGPQTLLHTLNAEQNLDRLHWLISRFHGYVGDINFMGARFTSSEPALAPVMREVGKRGLVYFDDNSSPRSLAGQIAGANNLPFAKADVTVDSVASTTHIDKALARLEAHARQNGLAVGIATASAATIQRIGKWTKAIESRGFVLVPITATTIKPKSS